jgi:hypothetical protein
MENREKQLTHTESLAIIENMIALAKNKMTDDGFHFLLWGFLVVIASLVNYYFIAVHPKAFANLTWIAMPLIGAPAAIIYEMMKKKERMRGHTDAFYGYLWTGFGITIFFVIYYSVMSNISPIPFILALVGLATFVSGSIMKFKPLIFGGIWFWACSLLSAYSSPASQLLVNAAATFVGYIIPGIMLWRNYKLQDNV